MPAYIEMPKLSDTMTEGTVVKWRKAVGDRIEVGDVIAEIETDKAVMELEAFRRRLAAPFTAFRRFQRVPPRAYLLASPPLPRDLASGVLAVPSTPRRIGRLAIARALHRPCSFA